MTRTPEQNAQWLYELTERLSPEAEQALDILLQNEEDE